MSILNRFVRSPILREVDLYLIGRFRRRSKNANCGNAPVEGWLARWQEPM